MSTDKLLDMAEQISLNLAGYPKEDQPAKIHEHFMAFWTPTMRSQLLELIKSDQTDNDYSVLIAALELDSPTQ